MEDSASEFTIKKLKEEESSSVFIEPRARKQIRYFLDIMQEQKDGKEFQAFLSMKMDGDGKYIIKEIYLPKQKVSSGATEFTTEELNEFITENPTKLGTIHGGLHSHGNMGVFWSTTDDKWFEDMLNYFGDYVLGIVVNTAGEIKARIDRKICTNHGEYVLQEDKVPVTMPIERDAKLFKECEEEIMDKVEVEVYKRPEPADWGRRVADAYRDRSRYSLKDMKDSLFPLENDTGRFWIESASYYCDVADEREFVNTFNATADKTYGQLGDKLFGNTQLEQMLDKVFKQTCRELGTKCYKLPCPGYSRKGKEETGDYQTKLMECISEEDRQVLAEIKGEFRDRAMQ